MSKISTQQSHALTIAVFFNTILVIIRHSFNLHQYYKGGNPWMKVIDCNVFFQRFIDKYTCLAIPFFFLISGFLFFNNVNQLNDCLKKIKKRFFTLFIPYLYWNIILISLCLILSIFPQLRPQLQHTYKLQYSLSWIIEKLTYSPIVGQFWYIRTLFIFILLSPLYFLIFKSKLFSLSIIILSIILWDLVDTSIFSTEGICFFLLGGFLAYHMCLPPKRPCKIWLWLILPQVLIILIHVFSYKIPTYILNYILKICIFIQIYTNWQFCLHMASNAKVCLFLIEMNRHSFFLYATHSTILSGLSLYLSKLLPHNPYFSVFAYILCFFSTLFLSLAFSFYLRKSFPKFYSLLTGGRS